MAVQNNKAEGTVLLEMKHVKKSFDKSGVLKDISLKVREGQVVSIIGPSGSGKSTLLRCATLLEKMDAGELIYLFNLKVSFRKLDWPLKEKRKAALVLAVLTAPYLFLFPSILLYR